MKMYHYTITIAVEAETAQEAWDQYIEHLSEPFIVENFTTTEVVEKNDANYASRCVTCNVDLDSANAGILPGICAICEGIES